MKKYLLMIFLMVLSLYQLYPKVTVVIADLSVDPVFLEGHDENFYTDMLFNNLYSKVSDKDYTYLLARSVGDNKVIDWKIKNEIEAYAVIDDIDLNYLVYGSITYDKNKFISKFNIYSKKDEKVIKEIVYENQMEDKGVFVKESAFKIDLAVYEMLKPENKKNTDKLTDDISNYNRDKDLKDRFRNFRVYEYLGFNFSMGYAVPCGDWSNLFIGIINFETGLKIVRLPYLYNKNFFKISIRPGFTFSYNLAKNRPDIVEEYFNSFAFRFPAELLFIFKDKYILNANFDVHVRVDYYYQNLYNIRKNYYTSAAFGWSTGLGFEYEIDKEGILTIGLNNFIDFAVYDIFYLDYKIQAYLVVKIKESKKPEKINIDEIKIKL
jgi:hypothetical protein